MEVAGVGPAISTLPASHVPINTLPPTMEIRGVEPQLYGGLFWVCYHCSVQVVQLLGHPHEWTDGESNSDFLDATEVCSRYTTGPEFVDV